MLYLGVVNYGANDSIDKADFQFRFLAADSVERHYYMDTDHGRFTLHNRLKEGDSFAVTTRGDTIVDLVSTRGRVDFHPQEDGGGTDPGAPHQGVSTRGRVDFHPQEDGGGTDPGAPHQEMSGRGRPDFYPAERTLTNLLRTAIQPMGRTLYVFGGAWNWQDNGGDANSTTIGVPQDWIDFFQANDASYEYKNPDPTISYYPFLGYNEYHYCGADCSGFVGWTVYNTLHDEPGGQSYVMSSRIMAQTLADTYHLGTFAKDKELKTGDIVSMPGHVYMVIGRCDDGSLLIAHSTVNHGKGSGPQLSAVSDDPNCEAAELARRYMSRFPEWHVRYDTMVKDPKVYLDFDSQPTYGHFTWDSAVLPDPDGLLSKTPEEILNIIFE